MLLSLELHLAYDTTHQLLRIETIARKSAYARKTFTEEMEMLLNFLKRFALITATVALGVGISGCAAQTESTSSASSSSSSTEAALSGPADTVVHIGTMPTEDALPFWVAETDGISADGVTIQVVTFDSAQALSAAIASGDVEMAMTDIMRAAKLTESGTGVDMEWVALGQSADEGVFGVMAAADAPYDNLEGLAQYVNNGNPTGMAVGIGANTVPEYVFDKLCEQAGIDPSTIPTEEVASLPERYNLMANEHLLAAALPQSMLVFGEANGMKLLAQDSTGENISQSVIVANSAWAAENESLIMDVASVWDKAATAIQDDPEKYRDLLSQKANLNSDIAKTYPISHYPQAIVDGALNHPSDSIVAPVLEWMVQKGYGSAISYNPETGKLG